MTELAFGDALAAKEGKFDRFDPANVSPMVAYLPPRCAGQREVFIGGRLASAAGQTVGERPAWKLDTEAAGASRAWPKRSPRPGCRGRRLDANPDKA